MASTYAAIGCALLALLLWVPAGWLIARRLPLESALRLAVAPILGWAMQGIVALWICTLGGFSTATVLAATVTVCAVSLLGARPAEASPMGHHFPVWAFFAIGLVAVAPALAVLPKFFPDGVAVSAPIYDHSKLALVDEMVRTGLPPANPFIGGGVEPGSVAYYYFWLFGAAQLALVAGARGWEADIAATWFTAFASLMLICGLAYRLSGQRQTSIAFVLVAALGGSLRPVLSAIFGQETMTAAMQPPTGLTNWLVQSSWSPHHVAAGVTVVLAVLILQQLARRPAIAPTVVLAGIAAVGYASSLWVGGVAFVLCGGAAGLALLARADPVQRWPFIVAVVIAVVGALALVLPLVLEQMRAAGGRHDTMPVLISPLLVLGPAIPQGLRWLLDIPAYWFVLLPIEFPVTFLLGAIGAWRMRKSADTPILVAAIASLATGGLLVSNVGGNNDLGWRAVLPGLIILTAFAAAYFARSLARWRVSIVAAGIALLLLALPDGSSTLHNNAFGWLSRDAARFRDAPALWAAVRQHTKPDERIASNPRMTIDVTPWPITLSWALLADRRSCFAGDELVLVFSRLPLQQRQAASALFDRVFAGTATDGDLLALVRDFRCRVIVLTPEDGAWRQDPFAAYPSFVRVEDVAGRWRIYRALP